MKYSKDQLITFNIAVRCDSQKDVDTYQDELHIHNNPIFDNFNRGDCFLMASFDETRILKADEHLARANGFDVITAEEQFGLAKPSITKPRKKLMENTL